MRKLARQIAFLLIYSSDMGQTDYQDVLEHILHDKENLEDFLEAANIISIFPELDEDTLESALEDDDKAFIADTVAGRTTRWILIISSMRRQNIGAR